eukprot:EG_transcript_15377
MAATLHQRQRLELQRLQHAVQELDEQAKGQRTPTTPGEGRRQQEAREQQAMMRRRQEAMEQMEAAQKARLEREHQQRQRCAVVEQESLFRRQMEAEEVRGLERVALREKEARRALYSDLQRDVLLQRKSDSVRRLEEERRWSKLSPSQQLEELVWALRHEESAGRTCIGREAAEALDAISDEFEGTWPEVQRVVCWKADDSYRACSVCLGRFGLLRRRHHCRRCGELVCGGCSRNKGLPLPASATHGWPVDKLAPGQVARICDRCFANPSRSDIEWHDRSEVLNWRPLPRDVMEEDWVRLEPTEPHRPSRQSGGEQQATA